jgi:hypothetical protein
MLAAQSTAQSLEAVKLIAVLSACIMVMFWREVIKLAIVAIVTAALVLLAVGAFTLLESMH